MKGINLLETLKKKFTSEVLENNFPIVKKSDYIANTYIRGISNESNSTISPQKPISEEMIFIFLKFQHGVTKKSGLPYLREIVAEDFLKEIFELSYEQASKFLNYLIETGLNKEDQWGAFPGATITKKGIQFYKSKREKYEKKDN